MLTDEKVKTSEVIIEKFMIEITRYPNGQTFQRIFRVGKDIKPNKKKPRKKKTMTQTTIEEQEEY